MFNGPDYVEARDKQRLLNQRDRVFSVMADGVWRTLEDITRATGDPHASISAQLRHLRKPRFGGHTVDRRHIGSGVYEYRLLASQAA